MTLQQSKEHLDQLLPLAKTCPTPKGLNHAAGLLIHNCRLQLFEAMIAETDFNQIVATMGDTAEREEAKQIVTENLWNSTQLMQLQEHVNFLKSESRIQLSNFQNEPAIRENLPLALQLLKYSREISPLQPVVHLRLAQINSVLVELSEADRCMERTLEVAPMNATFRKLAGLYYIQSNRPQLAAEQFRRELELQPNQFMTTMDIVTGRSNRSIEPMSADLISNTMLPDDPKMLHRYATKFQIFDPESKHATLERAANILDRLEYRDTSENKLLGDIRNLQGENEKAVQAYNDYLLIDPHDPKYLRKRALLHEELGNFELALEDLNRLADRAADPTRYRKELRELRRRISEGEENGR